MTQEMALGNDCHTGVVFIIKCPAEIPDDFAKQM
jgi:hypothetical protein